MIKQDLVFITVIVTAFLITGQVFAGETGMIQGRVLDAAGEPLPGVMVTAQSPDLQGRRVVESDASGRFRFPVLPVGSYDITIELMGFAPLKQTQIPVRVDSVSPVEIRMSETALKEVIVVEAEAVLIERDTVDLSTRISSEELEILPSTTREIRDLTKLVPGVTGVRANTVDGTSEDGFPSIRGEGQYGNNYLIDGLSVRDPAVKSTGTPLNMDAIREVQIITDGFSPEYGRALGGIVNVITKSGSNDFSGELALQYESDVLASEERDSIWASTQDYEDIMPYLNFGGPIVRDKLWYFMSYNRADLTDSWEGRELEGGGRTFDVAAVDQEDIRNNWFGKLTWSINPNNTLSLSGTMRDSELDNLDVDELAVDEARGTEERDESRIRLNLKSLISDQTVLEAKVGFTDREITQLPSSGDMSAAQHRDIDSGTRWGNYSQTDLMERNRTDYAVNLTQFVDDFYGDHEFKGGVSFHQTSSSRDLHFSGSGEDPFPDRMYGGTEYLWSGDTPVTLYDYEGAKVENDTAGYGFFLQDKWNPTDPLHVMFGLRMDSQAVENDAGEELFAFSFGDTIAPRISFAYDITNDGKNVVKFGAGRFYDVVSTSLAEWGNTANPYSFDQYQWGGTNPYTGDPMHNNGDPHDPDNWGRWRRYDDDGDGTYDRYEFTPGEPRWTQSSEHNPLFYDPDLKPYHKDEYLIEYNRAFSDRYAAKIRYVFGRTRDLIEDVAYYEHTDWDDPDNYISDWRIVNFERKRRDYRAVELELSGRPMRGVLFNLSYVNSSAKGTNPGQFERGGFQSSWGSGNDVGVFGDRPPHDQNGDGFIDDEEEDIWNLLGGLGGLDGDDGWYGYLPYSVDHQILLNGYLHAPYDFVVGMTFEWNSGYHWQKRGWQDAYGGYLTFPDGRGNREMPSIYYLDLSLLKRFNVFRNHYLGMRIDLFNVFDNDTAISYVQEDSDNFGEILKRQDPRAARITLSYTF